MKLLLLAVIAFTAVYAQVRPDDERMLPIFLIAEAQRIVMVAEDELEKHYINERQQLTERMEAEITRVRMLERELMKLDMAVRLQLHQLHQYEERLMQHEHILAEESLLVANRHDEEQRARNPDKEFNEVILPEQMIKRAQELIARAEAELKDHWVNDRRETQLFEAEIEAVRILERELQALEKAKKLDVHQVHQIDQRLLHAENRLAEESLKIRNRHAEKISA